MKVAVKKSHICIYNPLNVARWPATEVCSKQRSRWWSSYHYSPALHRLLRQTSACSASLQHGCLPPQTFFTGSVILLCHHKWILTALLPPLIKLPRQCGKEFRPHIVADGDQVHFQWQLRPRSPSFLGLLSASPRHLTISLGSSPVHTEVAAEVDFPPRSRFQIHNFHFFRLVYFQQTLLMFKPCYLCVSSIFYAHLHYLRFYHPRRQGSCLTYLGPEKAENQEHKRCLENAARKLMEKEVRLKQNRREEEESHEAFCSALGACTWTPSPAGHSVSIIPPAQLYRSHFTFSQCFAYPPQGTFAHKITSDSQWAILGGGQGRPVLVWLMGRMRLREGTWQSRLCTRSFLQTVIDSLNHLLHSFTL